MAITTEQEDLLNNRSGALNRKVQLGTLIKNAESSNPSHSIEFAARYTTTGGAASEAITLTGALSSDLSFVRLVNDGTNNVTISSWAMTANTLTVTFSGDPDADTVIEYMVIRAVSYE